MTDAPSGHRPSDQSLSRQLSARFGVDYSDIFPHLLEILLQPEEMELLLATPDHAKAIALVETLPPDHIPQRRPFNPSHTPPEAE